MQLGMVGLGRMGANMTRRLVKARHECVVYDIHPEAAKALASEGVIAAPTLAELVAKLCHTRSQEAFDRLGGGAEHLPICDEPVCL